MSLFPKNRTTCYTPPSTESCRLPDAICCSCPTIITLVLCAVCFLVCFCIVPTITRQPASEEWRAANVNVPLEIHENRKWNIRHKSVEQGSVYARRKCIKTIYRASKNNSPCRAPVSVRVVPFILPLFLLMIFLLVCFNRYYFYSCCRSIISTRSFDTRWWSGALQPFKATGKSVRVHRKIKRHYQTLYKLLEFMSFSAFPPHLLRL